MCCELGQGRIAPTPVRAVHVAAAVAADAQLVLEVRVQLGRKVLFPQLEQCCPVLLWQP